MSKTKNKHHRSSVSVERAAPRAFLRNSTLPAQSAKMSGTVMRSLLSRLGEINTDDSPQKIVQKLNNSEFKSSKPVGQTAVEIVCPGFSGRFEVRDLCAMTRGG